MTNATTTATAAERVAPYSATALVPTPRRTGELRRRITCATCPVCNAARTA